MEESLERELMYIKKEIISLRSEISKIYRMLGKRVEEREDALLKEVKVTNMRVAELLMEWASFLLSKVGEEDLDAVLDYYVSIGWISNAVADTVKRYARGLRVESVKGYMDPEDHVKSLDYINRIKEAMG